MTLPEWSDVVAAAGRLQGRVRETPVMQADALSARCDREVFLKCENLQHAGAFKFRGASNALLALAERGIQPSRVVTHSSGNHGAALARAARELGWVATRSGIDNIIRTALAWHQADWESGDTHKHDEAPAR